MYVCMYACMYVCMHVCMYVCPITGLRLKYMGLHIVFGMWCSSWMLSQTLTQRRSRTGRIEDDREWVQRYWRWLTAQQKDDKITVNKRHLSNGSTFTNENFWPTFSSIYRWHKFHQERYVICTCSLYHRFFEYETRISKERYSGCKIYHSYYMSMHQCVC